MEKSAFGWPLHIFSKQQTAVAKNKHMWESFLQSQRVSSLHYVQPGIIIFKFIALSNTKEEIYVLVAVQLKCALAQS